MKIAALYDIHGNLPALEAVLDEVRAESVDRIVIGGDVFPGPLASEALDVLLSLDIPVDFLRGNGDRAVLAMAAGQEVTSVPESAHEAIRWNAGRLAPEHRLALESWPETVTVVRENDGMNEAGGTVLFCHATPRSDTEIFTRETPEESLREIFAEAGAATVVCGHTHMQFDRRIGSVRVVNAGSVGMPFGEPGAHWLLLGPDIEHRRTGYDLDAAAARIEVTDYPGGREFAQNNVLRPSSAQGMLKVFARMEVK